MGSKISDLTGIVRPVATDVYEVESVAEGSVKNDHWTLLQGPMLPAISQALGYTSANIVEVEANTKAMRVTVRPTDLGGGQDQMFTVSRHAVGIQTSLTLTTLSYTDFSFVAGWWTWTGIAFLNKVSVSMCTSAVSGARTGPSMLRLTEVNPMIALSAATNLFVPPMGTPSPNASTGLFSSLKNDQLQPSLFLAATLTNTSIAYSGLEVFSKPLGLVFGGARLLAGEQNIPPTMLFDAWANGSYQPYTMATNTGFSIAGDGPAAGTSQTINVAASLQWDEWVPAPQDRI
jgi:hypothetical protein